MSSSKDVIDVRKPKTPHPSRRVRYWVFLVLLFLMIFTLVTYFVLRHLEDLNAVDTFYLTVSTLTTTGYGDVAARTPGGRIFISVMSIVMTILYFSIIAFIGILLLNTRLIH